MLQGNSLDPSHQKDDGFYCESDGTLSSHPPLYSGTLSRHPPRYSGTLSRHPPRYSWNLIETSTLLQWNIIESSVSLQLEPYRDIHLDAVEHYRDIHLVTVGTLSRHPPRYSGTLSSHPPRYSWNIIEPSTSLQLEHYRAIQASLKIMHHEKSCIAGRYTCPARGHTRIKKEQHLSIGLGCILLFNIKVDFKKSIEDSDKRDINIASTSIYLF